PVPLDRLGDRHDGDCLLVEAVDADDRVLGQNSWSRRGEFSFPPLRRGSGPADFSDAPRGRGVAAAVPCVGPLSSPAHREASAGKAWDF
ncbi:hypothetical protein, partial [Nocardia testacea]|uniref:hypothetical protein n=1 Tax=Nocardia testacea TaxID=248551 RepID=UPI0034030247